MFRLLWQKKALIVFLVVLVVLLPSAVSRPAQMSSKAVLTEITIDKADGKYTLTGQMAQGKPGGMGADKKIEPVTGSGASVGDAINKISKEQGRDVSFAHCSLIIMGKGLAGENLADLLQYFLFRTEINNNCAVAWGEKGRKTTLEKFYKDYLRYTAASVLTQGPQQTAVFKSGTYAFSLDEAGTDALGFLRGEKPKKRMTYDKEVLHILSNSANIKTTMEDGVPRVNITVKTKMVLESNPLADARSLSKIETAVSAKLEKDMEDTLALLFKERADLLGLYDRFRRYHAQKSFNDFFDEIQITLKVDCCVIN